MTRAIGVALFALVGLAGCETTPVHELSYSEQQEWAKQIVQRCYDQGIGPNSPQLSDCVRAEALRDASLRYTNAQRQQRFAEALRDAGNQMQANARHQQMINAMNRPINCRSQPMGAGTYSTSCY